MTSSIKYLILTASMALCLMVVPAFSASLDEHNNTSLNDSALLIMPVHYSGSGFATSESQYHVLKMNIMGVVQFDLEKINGLISDNKTLAQIKSDMKTEINSEIDAAPYNGSIMLGSDYFLLSNIKSASVSDENTTIDADVAGPITFADMSNASTIVGHISMTVSSHENSIIGNGKLTMNNGTYSDEYDALIKMGYERSDFKRTEMKCMRNRH